MSQVFVVGEVIDSDDIFEFAILHKRAQYIASDASKSIDCVISHGCDIKLLIALCVCRTGRDYGCQIPQVNSCVDHLLIYMSHHPRLDWNLNTQTGSLLKLLLWQCELMARSPTAQACY